MFKHFLDAFPGVPAVTFIVKGDSPTTQPKPTIEGKTAITPYTTPVTLPQPYYDVVVGAGYRVELIDEQDKETEAEGVDAPAADGAPDETLGGGSDASAGGSEDQSGAPGADPAPAFDADAVIVGNVEDVVVRLSELTDEQLALVKDAEIDREKPRVGVTGAIDAEIAARAAAKQGDGA